MGYNLFCAGIFSDFHMLCVIKTGYIQLDHFPNESERYQARIERCSSLPNRTYFYILNFHGGVSGNSNFQAMMSASKSNSSNDSLRPLQFNYLIVLRAPEAGNEPFWNLKKVEKFVFLKKKYFFRVCQLGLVARCF